MGANTYPKAPLNPTRFPGGLTNAAPTEVLGNMGQFDPTRFITFFEDFILPAAALGTFTAVDGYGGLVTAATTNAIASPHKPFVLNASKRFFFKARYSIAAVAQTALFGIVDALSPPTKGVSVSVVGSTLTLKIWNIASTTATATVSYANDEVVEIGFEYIPNKRVVAYFKGVPVVSIYDLSNLDTATALLAGFLPTGSTITADYILAAQER